MTWIYYCGGDHKGGGSGLTTGPSGAIGRFF